MNDDCKNSQCNNCCSENTEVPRRRRGLTSVTLQWIADKFRRAQEIKTELSNGTYKVDSSKVAQAIISTESKAK